LQVTASQFAGQALQESAGKSGMSDGIMRVIAARQKFREYRVAKYPKPVKAKSESRAAPRLASTTGRPIGEE